MFEEILQGTMRYLEGLLGKDAPEITPRSHLMDDLALSSLEMLNGLLMLEDTYGIVIPEKYLRKILTVEDVARVVTEFVEKMAR